MECKTQLICEPLPQSGLLGHYPDTSDRDTDNTDENKVARSGATTIDLIFNVSGCIIFESSVDKKNKVIFHIQKN